MLQIFFPKSFTNLFSGGFNFERIVKIYGNLELINNLFPNLNDEILNRLLFNSVEVNNLELVEDLLKKECDPNIQDANGNIPLYYAYTKEMLGLLIEYNTDIHIKNNNQISISDIVSDDFQYKRPLNISWLTFQDQQKQLANLKTLYNECQEDFLRDSKIADCYAELSGQD